MVAGVAHVLRLFGNLLRLLLSPIWLVARLAWLRGEPRWVMVQLHARLTPFRRPSSWLGRLRDRGDDPAEVRALEELQRLVERVVSDRQVAGVAVRLPALAAGWATCESVRDMFRQLRAAGKQVVCYLPQGGGNRELYVALAANRIYMAPFSSFGPLGLASAPLYVQPLLGRLGIAVEAQAAGEYKSAAEPALRDTMSDPAREQLTALLDGMHDALVAGLQDARKLAPEQVASLFERALLLADDALASGLIDGVCYDDELPKRLRAVPDADAQRPPAPLPAARYLARTAPLWRPLRRKPFVAVVPLHGTIMGDEASRMGAGLTPHALSSVLERLRSDAKVRAVVLHIDSPGGSALASEQMHRAISQLAQHKPVVACFGEVAASGGYYVACACKKIVAQALTITGSIGVVSAKPDLSQLLERVGVRRQAVRTTQSADMLSVARGLSLHEQDVLRAQVAALYERFVAVVAQGRGRGVDEVEPLARGRVWSGRDAHARGLVDQLGGLSEALNAARSLVAVEPAARAALEARVQRLRSRPGLGLGGLRAALLAPWSRLLSELAFAEVLRREPAAYLSPWTRID